MDAKQQNLSTVRRALGRSRAAFLVLAAFVLALGWLMAPAGESVGYSIAAWGMVAFFALIAGTLAWVALVKQNPRRAPLVVALRDRPDDVVWLYRKDFAVAMDGVRVSDAVPVVRDCNLIASLADGSTCAIVVGKEKADVVFAALTALAPRAATGFSEQRQAEFKRDPRSLLGAGPVAVAQAAA